MTGDYPPRIVFPEDDPPGNNSPGDDCLEDYPPMIHLDVRKDSKASEQSTHIEIDIVGTSEENKFTLIPTQSEGESCV